MRIKEIKTNKELLSFIKLPWTIYKNDPNWVPPLINDVKFALIESPFWEHSKKILYMAYDDSGKPTGRIAGVIDNNYIEFQNEKTGFFGFFECVNDKDTAQALLDKVKAWLAQNGMENMLGPTNPSTNDEIGFLCDGFGVPPRLMMPYNPPYYLELMEQCGMKYAKEVYAYNMQVTQGPLNRLERISRITYSKIPGLKVRKFDIRDFENEIKKAVVVYNSAWEKNWGFVPWTQKEFYTIASKLKDLLLLDTTLLATIDDAPAGMLIAVPDYNYVLQKMNGRLFPFGILKFLYYKSRINTLRLMIMGVVKEYRQRGIEGVMYYESLKNSMRLGFKECEFSWILEDNIMTQRAAEMMGGKLYKKYRLYEAPLLNLK